MTKKLKTGLSGLQRVLDLYGSDHSRWPESERAALSRLAGADARALRLLNEAKALDHLLDIGPSIAASEDLKSRIVAAAVHDTDRDARVVPIPAAKSRAAPFGRARRIMPYWPAAALAASFSLGLYLGFAGMGAQAFERALENTGLVRAGSEIESATWLDSNTAPTVEDIL